jgi:hypothetical protein
MGGQGVCQEALTLPMNKFSEFLEARTWTKRWYGEDDGYWVPAGIVRGPVIGVIYSARG